MLSDRGELQESRFTDCKGSELMPHSPVAGEAGAGVLATVAELGCCDGLFHLVNFRSVQRGGRGRPCPGDSTLADRSGFASCELSALFVRHIQHSESAARVKFAANTYIDGAEM